MKPFSKWYARICGFAAVSAIAVQSFILNNLSILQLPKWLNFIIPFVAATTVYATLYNVLVWIYELKGWKWVLRQYDVSGIW
jgi:zinc transporter ZupT